MTQKGTWFAGGTLPLMHMVEEKNHEALPLVVTSTVRRNGDSGTATELSRRDLRYEVSWKCLKK
jgi:hypothetical protein